MPGNKLSLAERAKIVELHLQGFSNCRIEKLTGKTRSTILSTMRMYIKGEIDLKAARNYTYKETKSRFAKLALEPSSPAPLAVQVVENKSDLEKLDEQIFKAKLKVQEMKEANLQGKGKISALNQAENLYRSLKSERKNLLNHE